MSELDGPDMDARVFTLLDLRAAQRDSWKQGIEATLMAIDLGATTAFVRERLLSDEDPR